MSVAERLTADMKDAMKNKDKFALTVIRTIRSELKYAELETGKSLSDEDSFQILKREIKKRKESMDDYLKINRQ